MSRSGSDFHYSKNIICCQRYDNKPVLLLAINFDAMSGVSNVMRWTKGSATKISVCPNIIKLYNNGMGGTDIMDQKPALQQWHGWCIYNGSKNSCLQARS